MILNKKPRLLAAVAIAVTALTGCGSTMAPTYERAQLPIANQWPNTVGRTEGSSATAIHWEALISDVTLRNLVRLALDNNRDLRIAALNVEKARAQYGIQRSELLPSLGAGFSGSSGRTPASLSTTGEAQVSHAYALNVVITSYELDLFGRVRSLKDQALQQYLASEWAQRGARISLIAAVAGAYLDFAADSERLELARKTKQSRMEAYVLQRQLSDLGSDSGLSSRQAEAEFEAAADQSLLLESTVAGDRNALEMLVGSPLPTTFKPASVLDAMREDDDIPEGLPSDLLQRRPDIVAAEHALMAANANIGAARASFFPSIRLTGGIGRASDSLSSLFDGGNRAWSFAPSVSLPIFTGGRLQAGLEVAQADRDIALAEYERSIQSAFREVADALAQRTSLAGRLMAQRRGLQASEEAFRLVSQRYEAGISGYLEVLDAQRTLYAAQQNWIAIRLAHRSNLITVYKALGGDWSAPDGGAPAAQISEAPRSEGVTSLFTTRLK